MKKKSYWTEMGIAAKKHLHSIRVKKKVGPFTRYYEPTIYNTKINKSVPPVYLSDEEYKAKFKQEREEKKKRLEDIPFSEYRNKLISMAYGKPDNSLRKAVREAKHEADIRKRLFSMQLQKMYKFQKRNESKPNLMVIRIESDKWKISDYMCIPTHRKLAELFAIGKQLSKDLAISMRNFFSIEIWERENYISAHNGGHGNPRYTIYKPAA